MTRLRSVTASVSRSAGVAVAGAPGFLGGWWLSFFAMRQDLSGPVVVPIAFALTGLFCTVLLFSALTKATPSECAVGAGVVLAVLIILNAIGNGGFPVAEDHEAWGVVSITSLAGIVVGVFAALLGRHVRNLLRPNESGAAGP